MAVTSNWTDPSDGGSMDRAAGQALTEAIYEYILSNFKFLGGTNGGNGFIKQLNLLTNGGFEMWQRGAGPFNTNGVYGPDKWYVDIFGTDTLQVDREGVIKKSNSLYSAKCAFVLGTGAGATAIYNTIKISDGFHHLLGKITSLRFPVYATAASAVRVFVRSDGTGGTTTYSGYHTGNSAWADLDVINITIPSDATYIEVGVKFAASVTAYLDNAMHIPGSIAADYMPLHPAEEMARCQRYLEVIGQDASGAIVFSGNGTGAGAAYYYNLPFKVEKAATPTVTINGTWTVSNCGQPGVAIQDKTGARITVSASAAGTFYTLNSAAGCNIAVEANP